MTYRAFPLSTLAFACTAALAGPLPTGGTVTQGSGRITTSGNTMVVDQHSERLVTDWQTFSIGAGQTVRFVQPDANAVALNRVIGGDPSSILGHLQGNGHVIIENAAGVLFAKGAQVDVGSLVATSLSVDTTQLDAGRLRLSGDGTRGAVVNEGRITVGTGGSVVLAGPQVSNTGSIVAAGGNIALVAASAVDVDPSGSGLLSVHVTGAAVDARLANSGTLAADGGSVTLAAAAHDAALDTVMRIGGVVRARSVGTRDGQIVLSGGDEGVVAVDGKVDASGVGAARGGAVQVLGTHVELHDGTDIDVTGVSGGGRVLVGGDFHGAATVQAAATTWVADGARIDASATGQGNGGQVAVWSDRVTDFGGTIVARGGARSGDGGRVEVSGRQRLDFEGAVDTRAPAGHAGQLLLDPEQLTVGNTADANGDGSTGDDLTGTSLLYADTGASTHSYISASKVATLLATNDVTLQATDLLEVTAPISVIASGDATTLRLNAEYVRLAAPITLNHSTLVVDTQSTGSDTIRIDAPVQSLNAIALTASVIQLAADVSAPSVTLAAPAGFDRGEVFQDAGGITAKTLDIRVPNGGVYLYGTTNHVDTLDVDAVYASIEIDNGGPLLHLGATIGNHLDLTVDGDVVQSRGLVIPDFQVTAGGSVVLDGTANDFGQVRFDVAGRIALADMNAIDVGGTAVGPIVIGAGGKLVLGADLSTTGAATTIDLRGAGFDDSANAALNVQPGGRFFIRSSDWTQDVLGSIAFGASGTDKVNYTILGGWSGADPAAGNGYYTNRTGTISAPNADRPGISRTYDGSTGFGYAQTGDTATGTLEGAPGSTTLGHYTVASHGDFADRNAGTNKGYTVAGTNDVVATTSDGSIVYGLRYDAFTRAAGPAGAIGNPVSVVTPKAITSTGLEGVDRDYDGSTVVSLDTGGGVLHGVIGGDDVRVAGGAGTMADKHVGQGKAVTATLTLGGADAGNYVVTDASGATVDIAPRALTVGGIGAVDRLADGSTAIGLRTGGASLSGVVGDDDVGLDTHGATGTVGSPAPGTGKDVVIGGLALTGVDARDYVLHAPALTVNLEDPLLEKFRQLRDHEYLQAVADVQEPFRRAMIESFLAGFTKENIRKPLMRGSVFETGLAPPAIDDIESDRPAACLPEALACPHAKGAAK